MTRISSMRNNVLNVSIFNIVHFHFFAVFSDLHYYFFIIIINVLFFAHAIPQQIVIPPKWYLGSLVMSWVLQTSRCCERLTHTNTLSPPTGSRFTSALILLYLYIWHPAHGQIEPTN